MKKRLDDLRAASTIDKNDPLMKLSHSIVDEDEELTKIYQKLGEKEYEEKFKPELSIVRTGTMLNKHSEEIATSKPWTGDEHPIDTSLRMLVDSVGNSMKKGDVPSNVGFRSRVRKGINGKSDVASVRSKITRDRLETTQDKVVRYQQDKQIEEKEASEFRALYAERFTPIGSFEKLRSIADARIEESMRNGGFDLVKPLHGSKNNASMQNPHIDRTEHHLNNMLVRQNIVPPWIEKQGSVNKDIEKLREELKTKFEREIVLQLEQKGVFSQSSGDLVKAMQSLNIEADVFLNNCFIKWKPTVSKYLDNRLKTLNNELRSYNLQAPLPTQKLYLTETRELQRVKENVDFFNLYKAERKLRESRHLLKPKSTTKPISLKNLFRFW